MYPLSGLIVTLRNQLRPWGQALIIVMLSALTYGVIEGPSNG